MDVVRNAIALADQQSNIMNYVGWIIACIQDGYKQPTETVFGSAEKAKRYNESTQNIKENEQTYASAFWEKIKHKENFPDFEKHLESNGVNLNTLEVLYEPSERVTMYMDWFHQVTGK
jgi:hypothetical protein